LIVKHLQYDFANGIYFIPLQKSSISNNQKVQYTILEHIWI